MTNDPAEVVVMPSDPVVLDPDAPPPSTTPVTVAPEKAANPNDHPPAAAFVADTTGVPANPLMQ